VFSPTKRQFNGLSNSIIVQKYHFGLLLSVVFLLTVSFSPSFGAEAGIAAFGAAVGDAISIPEGTAVPGCETTNECFVPYEVTVDVGSEVTWSNDDSAAHTVTSGSAADGSSGIFDSSLFMAGTTFSHTFDEAGTFPYYCMVHPWMTGMVSVVNTQPPPSPPPETDVIATQGSSETGCEETNSCYLPYSISTQMGETIIWFNQDSAAHTVTSGNAADGPDGVFDSSLFMAGTTFSHTFEAPGEFPYFCMVHPWMDGVVTVINSANLPPLTAPIFAVTTDKHTYSMGEVIAVSGSVSGAFDENIEYGLRVIDPNGKIGNSNFLFDSENNFSFNLLNSENWSGPGIYTVQLVYGDEVKAEVTFALEEGASAPRENYGDYYGKITSVDISYPSEIHAGEQVIFDASGTFDKDGKVTEYHWWFYSDSETDSYNYDMRYGESVPYTFLSSGTMIVEWEFVIDTGKFEDGSFAIQVLEPSSENGIKENLPPEIVFWDDGDITVGDMITFDASGSSDPDGTIEKYEWRFGDGTVGTGATTTHTYSSAGNKQVTIGLTDNGGLYVEAVYNVKVVRSSNGGGSSGPDLTIIIIVIGIAAVAAGAGIAISRSRKSSSSKTVSKSETSSTESSKSKSYEKGWECNVCGTRIPDGTNVCPNCGDTYS